MKSKLNNLLFFVLAAYVFMAVVYVFTPTTTGQSDRGQCQQQCTQEYQRCRNTANANQNSCKQAFDACRARCRTGTNTNTNTNTNMNGNTNTNTNNGH